jgi:hypothetical protein
MSARVLACMVALDALVGGHRGGRGIPSFECVYSDGCSLSTPRDRVCIAIPECGSGGGGKGDDAANPRLLVAQARYRFERKATWCEVEIRNSTIDCCPGYSSIAWERSTPTGPAAAIRK